ncbi:MAG TPA: hypothetical protein VGP96_14005 [Candidatus Dormibacteraeota bacterium]|nr:hypothetical protein [Candidatus Dormibacteraeota bacterium]
MNVFRLAPVLSVAGALALGVGAASASGVGPIGSLPAAPVSSPVLGGTVSSVTPPAGDAVSGTTGAVAGVAAPVAPLVNVAPRPQTTSTPPPPGNATADGAHVNPLDTCASCTGAGSDSGSSQSGATGLRVVGQTLSGGSSSSTGTQSGQLIALPANPLMTLAVANWMAAAEAPGGSSSSRSRSALVDLGLSNGQVATVAVLEAGSAAAFDGTASHGTGSTNGVNLTGGNGGLVLVLLHSEANSDGGRSAYLASLNGTTLGGTTQDGDIPVTVPGVITIHLLAVGANGGVAGAAIGSVNDVLSIPGQVASVLASTASGAGAPITMAPLLPTSGVASALAPSTHAAGPGVPLTGISVGAAGLVLLTSGLGLLRLSARRRRAAIA